MEIPEAKAVQFRCFQDTCKNNLFKTFILTLTSRSTANQSMSLVSQFNRN